MLKYSITQQANPSYNLAKTTTVYCNTYIKTVPDISRCKSFTISNTNE